MRVSAGHQKSAGGGALSASVLLVSYNGERFIGEQLESIRDQTLPVAEVVIADDDSRDGTQALVSSYIARSGLQHWRLVANPVNLGVARNVLGHLGEVRGDVVFLADQDDIWEAERVALMMDALAQDPALVLVASTSRRVDSQGRPYSNPGGRKPRVFSQAENRQLTFADFVGTSRVPMHAMCVRRVVLQRLIELGTFPELSSSLGADWLIGICATLTGTCIELPDVLVRRRVHDANLSLGRLQKTTVLSSTQEGRQVRLREALAAHRFLLDSGLCDFAEHPEERRKLQSTINLLARRVEFGQRPSLGKWLGLSLQLPDYRLACDGVGPGARMWVTDLMYAYGVNWKLPKRDTRSRGKAEEHGA